MTSDITIRLADGTGINVKSDILAQRCMFFRHLLDPRFAESSNRDIIYMTDYDSLTVRHLVRYITHDELLISKKANITQLLVLCDLMCLPPLYSMICRVFDDVLYDDNCFQILEFTLQRNHQDLTTQCWKYIFKHYPHLLRPKKKHDWNHNMLKMTFTNECIRFIETSTIVKYFKYWCVSSRKRYMLLKRVIRDILKQDEPLGRCILELLECLANLFESNSCIKLCNQGQKLTLLVIGGYLGDADRFYEDKFVPHNEFHEHIQLGYSLRKSIPDMMVHRVLCASASDKNGFYIVGGRNIYGDLLESIEYYDYDENKWTKTFRMEEPKMLCAATCVDDKLYLSGGRNVNKKILNTVYLYLSNKNVWKRIADLNEGRAGHQMCTMYGAIYVLGGIGEDNATVKTVEYYDALNNKWLLLSPMTCPRLRFGAVVVQKYIFAIGGLDAKGNSIGNIEKYDSSTDTWSVITKTLQGVYDMGVAVCNKNVYICGGNTNNGAINTIEIFHSESGILRIISQLKIKRSGPGIFVLPDNDLFYWMFCRTCDSKTYLERYAKKCWKYPSIETNVKETFVERKIIDDFDFSLR